MYRESGQLQESENDVRPLVDNQSFLVTQSDSLSRSVCPSVRPFVEFTKYFLKKHS